MANGPKLPPTATRTSQVLQRDSVAPVLASTEATAYVTALREGGSLPGLMEAADLGLYVVKFRAAGQGPKALVAEIVVARIATALGLRVPRLVLIGVDEAIGRREPDDEVQDLLVRSAGTNLGIDFLPGSIGFDRGIERSRRLVDPAEAAAVIWLDAFTGNIDRTWRNPNLLLWHRQVWCIDHGAALGFAHSWGRADGFPTKPFGTDDHVLAGLARGDAGLADRFAAAVTPDVLRSALAEVPDVWLAPDELRPDAHAPADADAARERYVELLVQRLGAMPAWLPRWAETNDPASPGRAS